MPKDASSEITLKVVAGQPVTLPNGQFASSAEMAREGADLHLTSPDGQTIVVEGYFAQDPAPDLVTPDGARLSSQLVDSFLPPERAGQYAASGQSANDASPAGKITEVVGEAVITRADGTKVAATEGMPVFQGDVIETSKTGAVNIQFADNTTFAVSESARLSIDQFVYDSAAHSGTSFFSMLQGVFVYTSGLIGKSDPGNVHIETPVGSIGIRGTVVAGEINPAGEDSKITILDGAVTFTNGTGTQELNKSYETLSLNSYQDQPETTQMDAQTFNATYGSLSDVAGDTFSQFSEAAPGTEAAPEDGAAPAEGGEEGTAPEADAAPAEGEAATPDASAEPEAPAEEPAGEDSLQLDDSGLLDDAGSLDATFSDSSFDDGGNTFDTATGSTFDSASSDATTGDYANAPSDSSAPEPDAPPPPPPSTAPSSPSFAFNFMFSTDYTHFTASTADDGLEEFAPVGTIVGKVTPVNAAAGPVGYTLTVTNGNAADPSLQITPDIAGAGNYTTPTAVNLNTLFSIDANGYITVNNPLALSHYVNQSGFQLRIDATDSTGKTHTDTRLIQIQDFLPGLNPRVAVDVSMAASNGTGADFLVSTGTFNATLTSDGGEDVLIGNAGNNIIQIVDDTFEFINGGAGDDTIVLGNATSARMMPGGTAYEGDVVDIEKIDLGLSLEGGGTYGNRLRFDLKDVFDMTDSRHVLEIVATGSAFYSGADVVTGAGQFALQSGTIGGGIVEYRGTFDGQLVTLRIHQGASPLAAGGITVTEVAAPPPGMNFNFSPEYMNTTPLFPGQGINEFAAIGTVVGQVSTAGATSYTVTVNGALNPQHIVPDNSSGGTYTLQPMNLATAFSVDSAGIITVNDPMALSHFLNPGGLDLTITAYSGGTALGALTQHVQIRDYNGITADTMPIVSGTYAGPITGSASADLLVGDVTGTTNAILSGGGGADIIIGGGGSDILQASDAGFKLIDGGAGLDTLKLQNASTGVTLDFTTLTTGAVRNIETINLGLSVSGTSGSDITLNIQDIFEMTDASHVLTIVADGSALNSSVIIDTGGAGAFNLTTGSLTATPSNLTYTGTYNGSTVTLIIQNGMNLTATTGNVQVTEI